MRGAALVGYVVFTLFICGADGVLCQQSTAHGPTNPGRWVATPFATCEYGINAKRASAPHEAVSQLVGEHQTVCPFVTGQSAPAIALVTSLGEACGLGGTSDLTIVSRRPVTLRQFVKDLSRCDPMLGGTPTPPETSTSAGPVFVIMVAETDPDPQLYIQHFSEVRWALAQAGLPISYAIDWGRDDTHFFCFEMMQGDDIDPFSYLKTKLPWLSRAGKEHRSNAANCAKGARELGVEAPIRGIVPTGAPSQFVLSIKRSTASPEHQDYRSAVVNAFQRNGALAARDPSDHRVETLLPDQDAYARYDLSIRDLHGAKVGMKFTQSGLQLRITKMSPVLCNGIFAAIATTDSYVAEADYEAPDIAPTGLRGDPPARVVIRSLTWVGDAKELCQVIQPSFDRWLLAVANGVTQ